MLDNEGHGLIHVIAIGRMFINEKCLKEKEGDLGFIEAGKQGSHHERNCHEEGWRQLLSQNMKGRKALCG